MSSGSRAVAWRCDDCTRLSVVLDTQTPPLACEYCGGHLVWLPLERRPRTP